MTRKPNPAPPTEDYPSSLSGGEPRDDDHHRLGETERRSPRVDKVDPSASPGESAPGKTQPAAERGKRR
ncbi:MAG TPA: hypothetical protein VJ743_07860 [Albitalea sp.]|nr:hypothetical protein [Albitalea sp.]